MPLFPSFVSNLFSRGDKKLIRTATRNILFALLAECDIDSNQLAMVKKRTRDPEVLEEAPPAKSGADDSGSDDVRIFILTFTTEY